MLFGNGGSAADAQHLAAEMLVTRVSCSRADGLAFDVLRKLEKPSYILSTENNPVVSARAKKITNSSISRC